MEAVDEGYVWPVITDERAGITNKVIGDVELIGAEPRGWKRADCVSDGAEGDLVVADAVGRRRIAKDGGHPAGAVADSELDCKMRDLVSFVKVHG